MANTVNITVEADTKKAEKNLGGLGGKVKSLQKPVMMGAAATTAFAAAAVKLGDEFKAAENTIAAGTGATGEALEALTADFESVFANVPQDSQAVASAIADLNTELALQGEELQNASKAFLDISRVMGEDAQPMIKAVSDSMVAFGVPASEVEAQLDKLTTASQAVGVPMTTLAEQVVKFGPQLKEMGLSLDESTALFANMAAAGIETKAIMPGLSTAMQKMSKEGVTDMSVGLSDLIASIQNAGTETEAMAIATDAFGAGAGVRFKDAIRSGALEFDTLLEAMENSEGKVDALGESTLTTADKMDIMKNKVKGALAPIGGMASSNGPLVILIPGMTTAVSGMSVAMGALNLSMGPVLLVVLGLAAAIAAIILIWKNWDKILEGAVAIWETLKKAFNSKWGWLLPGGALIKAILMIKDNWDSIWGGMQSVVEGVVSGLKGPINGLIALINGVIEGVNGISVEIPSWVPKLGGKSFGFDIAPIPSLAEGGIVKSPTLAMIGERGPEAVVPLSRGVGGVTVNVMMPEGGTVILDDESTAERFGEFITGQVRQALRTQGAF